MIFLARVFYKLLSCYLLVLLLRLCFAKNVVNYPIHQRLHIEEYLPKKSAYAIFLDFLENATQQFWVKMLT